MNDLFNNCSPEILRLWPKVKALYLLVVDNAYSHRDDRETAHDVMLRLAASSADLLASRNKQALDLWDAVSKCLGTPQTDEDKENDEETAQAPANSPVPNLGHNLRAGQLDLNALAGIVGLPGLSETEVTGPTLNAEELQNIFSFMSPYMLGLNTPPVVDEQESVSSNNSDTREREREHVCTPMPHDDMYSDDLYD